MDLGEVPSAAPRDAMMATAEELARRDGWFAAAWLGQPPLGAVPLTVRRQDHSVLQFGRSCLDTPLRLGTTTYPHGLGTHATSEIAVKVPETARRFRAVVGVDNNDGTGGVRGSVVFAVRGADTELWRSELCRGGQPGREVDLALPVGTRELVLVVDDGGDGPAHDQADWADARLVLDDGSEIYLDSHQVDTLLAATGPPFDFTYGGRPVAELLPTWQRTVGEPALIGNAIEQSISWLDPSSGLRITANTRCYRDYPNVEWTVYLEQTGDDDTLLIEGLRGLATTLRSGYGAKPLTIHQLQGDACAEDSWQPFRTALLAGKQYRMAPTGGRPASITASPWFDLEYAQQGVIAAVGWSGQWEAVFDRSGTGPTRLAIGQEQTHFVLHPGEAARTPRIMLHFWHGDRQRAHVQFRRLMLHEVMPQAQGRPVRLPLAVQCYDRYVSRPDWATEGGQLAYVDAAARLGCDTVWLDAAWFPGGFPNGVGSWRAEPTQFPRGLAPIGEACRARGMNFMLWFEPERVAPGSDIAREQPQFVHGGQAGGLFRLDDPVARRWLTELLSKRISEYGVTIYRNDFNIDPLPFWRQNDTPDRQGLTEMRYVEGLYEMWDELRVRHPGLLIDNCASGGRRIDLELCGRSVPLWRSDTGCSPGHPEYNQMQACALGAYVPQFTIGLWDTTAYAARSTATGGVPLEADYLNPEYDWPDAARGLAEIESCRKYWYGDLYPLSPINTDRDQVCAWQLDRPDLHSGLVYAFRRPESRLAGLIAGLNATDVERTYEVTWSDDRRIERKQRVSGRELADGLVIRLPRPDGTNGTSVLVHYRRLP